MGWSAVAAGGVRSLTVPGDHLTMVREPHARQLAERLSALLDDADAAEEATRWRCPATT